MGREEIRPRTAPQHLAMTPVAIPELPEPRPVRKLEIQILSKIVGEKRARFQMLGMMNAQGLDEATRMQRSIEYTQAQSELWNAERALEAAIRSQP